MRDQERRNLAARAALVQVIVNDVIRNPSIMLSVDTLKAWLDVPPDAARRILTRLASSGLVREIREGTWVRGTWPGIQPMWR